MGAMEVLDEIAAVTGWDDTSKTLLLTQFIDSLTTEGRVLDPTQIEGELRQFLRNQALDEGVTEEELDSDLDDEDADTDEDEEG